MQFTWHLLVIMKEADMYRNYAYILFAVAIIVAVYYYYIQVSGIYVKASMCNAKAHMPGCTIQY
ncbi:hypothetical protein LCGC14_2513410 [marine sediment metagenome]|uniref:Uncharacterized protein n=1 Tax=marine sediment metagenome TaxID=412755 RepID=A0A0F9BLF7_9ZZZZ